MVATIFIIIYGLVILAIYSNPNTEYLLYSQDSEKHFEDAIKAFDKTKKEIDNLDISDYKLGSSHIY